MAQLSVLIIATSNSRLADSDITTGAWAEDIAVPYFYFKSKGYAVHFASPKGGKVPLDPDSLRPEVQRRCRAVRRFLADVEALAALDSTTSIVFARHTVYDAFYVAGGRGILFDGSANKELAALLGHALADGRCVATCGYGAAALLNVKSVVTKDYFVAGNEVTAPTAADDAASGAAQYLPFVLSEELKARGAVLSHADTPDAPWAVRAGKLITGQSSAAALRVAELVVETETFGVRITP